MNDSVARSFRPSLRRFVQEALGVMRRRVENHHFRIREIPTFAQAGCSIQHERRLDPFYLLRDTREECLNLPSLDPAAQALPGGDEARRLFGERKSRVYRLLEHYVFQYEDIGFDQRRLDAVQDLFLNTWKTRRGMAVLTLPLQGLPPLSRSLSLAEDVTLKPFTHRMQTQFWSQHLDGRFPLHTVLFARALLQIAIPFPVEIYSRGRLGISMQKELESCLDVITAIRLATGTAVGAVCVQRSILPSPRSDMDYSPHGPANPPGEMASVLRSSEERSRWRPHASGLLAQLRDARAGGRFAQLAPALRRFNDSYGRHNDADALVDLAIALEGTLLFGNSDELGYRLLLRGLLLLEGKDQGVTTSRLRELYRVRSEIVHNGHSLQDAVGKCRKVPVSVVDSRTFLAECTSLTAAILARYVQLAATGRHVSEVNQRIDLEIRERMAPKLTF